MRESRREETSQKEMKARIWTTHVAAKGVAVDVLYVVGTVDDII